MKIRDFRAIFPALVAIGAAACSRSQAAPERTLATHTPHTGGSAQPPASNVATAAAGAPANGASPAPGLAKDEAMPPEMQCMLAHYPAAEAQGAPGSLALVVKGWGDRLAYEVKPPFRAENPLRDFVVKDFFDPPYPRGPVVPITDKYMDPGRVRLESLFRATYGGGRNEVEARLITVTLGGQSVRVHERIREPMKRVDARLSELIKADRDLRKYFEHMGGTYNYRTIAGTEQLSTHAFGIAVDLSTYFSHYWRNEKEKAPEWKNSIPEKLVYAFEAEGFIWGGRWYHYDTMHFEYRPELLDERCRGR